MITSKIRKQSRKESGIPSETEEAPTYMFLKTNLRHSPHFFDLCAHEIPRRNK
ncbi:MAG TPA: hypothetical protein VFM82_11760 [Flavobacteriaceae bacterium]|nr:hypothetical protein [Flavobacteriaceae bacterium]